MLPRGATEPRVLVEAATDGRYIPTGHIFTRDGLLMAVPFDLDRLVVAGAPIALVDGVMEASGSGRPGANTGAAQFDVTPSGTLVYAPGGTFPSEPSRLVWVGRSGHVEPLSTPAGSYSRPRLSPDGRRVVVAFSPPSRREKSGVFIADLGRGSFSRLTADSEWGPLWSADGTDVYCMQQDGMGRIRADGSGQVEPLRDTRGYPHSVSPDGSLLAFQAHGAQTGSDIWLMPLPSTRAGRAGAADQKPRPLLQTPANEAWAEISPDGRWLAYGSDVSGRYEVYVQPFPGPGPRQQISLEGGNSPLWARSGRELFFAGEWGNNAGVQFLAVDVAPGPMFSVGKPRELFVGRYAMTGGPTGYDVSLDGRQFLMVERLEPSKQPVTHLRVVLNWFEELRRAQGMSK